MLLLSVCDSGYNWGRWEPPPVLSPSHAFLLLSGGLIPAGSHAALICLGLVCLEQKLGKPSMPLHVRGRF